MKPSLSMHWIAHVLIPKAIIASSGVFLCILAKQSSLTLTSVEWVTWLIYGPVFLTLLIVLPAYIPKFKETKPLRFRVIGRSLFTLLLLTTAWLQGLNPFQTFMYCLAIALLALGLTINARRR